MTKKDYIKFAEMMKRLRKGSVYINDKAVIQAVDVERELAAIFMSDNDRFDRDRFFKACNQ